MREEDEVLMLLPARTLDTLLLFSDRGKVYAQKVYQIPAAGRADKGVPTVNLLAMESDERITAAVTVRDFNASSSCTIATVQGMIKRVALSEFCQRAPVRVNRDEPGRKRQTGLGLPDEQR